MTVSTRLLGSLASAAVATALLAGCGTGDDQAEDPPATSASATPSDTASAPPSVSDSPTASGTASSGTADTVAVPAYFVGDTPLGQRLYREFRRVPAQDSADEALALVAGGDALDPDYTTLWPGGTLTVTSTDPTIVVQLGDDGATTAPAGMTAQAAKLAVQQVVHTVQGALQSSAPVTFTVGGTPATTVLGVSVPAEGFGPGNPLNVLALANVTSPEQGATVSGTFTAEGVASSFEGTVPWQVLDASGAKVLDGSAQADGYLDDVYPWKAEVDVSSLAAGTYTFVAMTDDPSGGEGPGPTEDTKTIIVG